MPASASPVVETTLPARSGTPSAASPAGDKHTAMAGHAIMSLAFIGRPLLDRVLMFDRASRSGENARTQRAVTALQFRENDTPRPARLQWPKTAVGALPGDTASASMWTGRRAQARVRAMQRNLPPYRADHVGSILRTAPLKEARAKHAAGALTAAELKAIEDEEISKIIAVQEAVGLRAVTDGEFRRAYWHFDFLAGLDGVAMVEAPG